jgi:hypothetical protein
MTSNSAASNPVTRRGAAQLWGAPAAGKRFAPVETQRKVTMRGILLWLLGIPIPILILLYLFHVI